MASASQLMAMLCVTLLVLLAGSTTRDLLAVAITVTLGALIIKQTLRASPRYPANSKKKRWVSLSTYTHKFSPDTATGPNSNKSDAVTQLPQVSYEAGVKEGEPASFRSSLLPASIDATAAVSSFRSQRELLLNLICHCLPKLANSLYAQRIIPKDVNKKACNENRGSSERGGALLECVEARIRVQPSDFTRVVHIMESNPFLDVLAEKLVQSYWTYSESRADDCSTAVTSAISHYRTYLKSVYRSSPISPENKWPPIPSKEYIHLAVVKGQTQKYHNQYIGPILEGNIQQVLKEREEIFLEQIMEQRCEGRVVLVEGAPGIGKSTLTWELCRKWEEFSCMKKYSLVVLLRLRVQNVTSVGQLFYSCDNPSLADEVSNIKGSGILFILDGFDELPLKLQNESYLLDLIGGRILPESKVLIQKHVEILGFTQESVEAYAKSVFSSEPEKLEKFKAYISASKNPAINSLMYIPLNAAIIVEIYNGCDCDKFLPHTLTELYTQLSLTILNRHMEVRMEKFEDLPRSLYEHFCTLSALAYNGFVNEEVIFHNFLHLTLQEFFAAYFISCLGSGVLEVFKWHGKDERWNIVWRFVAGLTKFKHLGPLDEGDVFINKRQFICRSNTLTKFFIECLFEAQTMKYWVFENTSFTELVKVYMSHLSGFDSYMLGYCIANYLHGVPLYVLLESSPVQPFLSGLKTASSCSGVIEELHISYCRDVNLAEFSALPLLHTMSLSFSCCRLVSTDLIILSQLIPHLHSLRMLGLTYNGEDGVLSVLQQLSHSKVTSLDLRGTDFSGDTPEQCYTALSNLISLLSGKLKELYFGRTQNCDRLISLVSAGPSSLNALYILEPESCISSLSSNTCITRLELDSPVRSEKRLSSVSHQVVEILKRNKTLLHLKLISFKFPGDIDALRVITDALSENNTLQCMEVWVLIVGESCRSHKFASKYMQKQQINPDAQITWKNCKYIVRIYPWP